MPISTGRPAAEHLARLLHHGVELGVLGREDRVGQHVALARPVGRHPRHPQPVDPPQLPEVLQQRAGHAGQLLVQPEEALVGDLGGVVAGHVDRHALLGLDRLVQPVAPVPVGHRPAGALVDDDDLLLVDHVVLVAAEAVVGVQRPLDVLRAACPSRASACRPAGSE